ncbi:MAG: MGDG synthase family glycosyltransferase [Candidatus Levyibacteriota bacterium]
MKVLILTASYGSGHVIAAKGLTEAFQEKGVEPVVFDLVIEGGKTERNAAAFYEFLMKRGHFVWKLYHDRIMPINKGNSIRKIYTLLHRKKFFKEIEEINPDIIVSTMDVASLIGSLYKKGHSDVKIFTVLTDYVAHPIWVWQNMDGYFVGSQETKEYLVNHGIAAEKISISGIPLRFQFEKKMTQKEAREKLGIPQDKRVILISAGSFKSVPVESIVHALSPRHDVYAVILAGSKNANVSTFADFLNYFRVEGKVLEYTDEMETFMTASDLYISKAGGLTVAECLSRGLPAVYINNFPGHEAGNAAYTSKNGAAVVAGRNNIKEVLDEVLGDRLELMKNHAEELGKPHASGEIVESILRTS